jgi:Na+-translocating ferredoxin:NAD+ oxidoreductase RnfG subunit
MRFTVFACCLALGLPAPASAATTFFTTPALLKEFFPTSARVTYRKLTVSPEQAKALSERLGYKLPRREYVIFVALSGENTDGYAIVDDEVGQHEPITFGVKLTRQGTVERQEVMVYRESYGQEIVDPRFRKQFVGKGRSDPVRAGVDVDVITGATISCRSMAAGVRRAIALLEVLVLAPLRAPGQAAVLTAPKG